LARAQVLKFGGKRSAKPGEFIGVAARTAAHPFDVVFHRGRLLVSMHTGQKARAAPAGAPRVQAPAVLLQGWGESHSCSSAAPGTHRAWSWAVCALCTSGVCLSGMHALKLLKRQA